jgi:hypothetical protein
MEDLQGGFGKGKAFCKAKTSVGRFAGAATAALGKYGLEKKEKQ